MLGAVAAARLSAGPEAFAWLAPGYTYVILAAAALLAARFHRSRVLAAVAALGIVVRLTQLQPGPLSPTLYAASATLLPLTLTLLVALRDFYIVSLRGLAHLALVLVQPAILYVVLRLQPEHTAGFFSLQFFDPGLTAWTPLPQLAVLAYGVAVLLTLVVALRRRRPVQRGFLWALLCTFFVFDTAPNASLSMLYLTAAALVLGLAVMEASYGLAYRDELTGLPARRAFHDALTALGGRYSIAMIDVDHFKRVNDRHGHDVGDQVLRMVATRLKRVAGGGRPFRYGGEEFTVVFGGKSREMAKAHLEEIRADIESYEFKVRGAERRRKKPGKNARRRKPGGKSLAVTVSIGVADRSGKRSTPELVLKAADKALYKAKKNGRNQISM